MASLLHRSNWATTRPPGAARMSVSGLTPRAQGYDRPQKRKSGGNQAKRNLPKHQRADSAICSKIRQTPFYERWCPMSTIPIANILALLTTVRRRKPGQWSARCPAHADICTICANGYRLVRFACWGAACTAACRAAPQHGAAAPGVCPLGP